MRCLSTCLYWIHTLFISIQRNEVFIYFFVLNTYAMHKHTKKWGVYLLFCTEYIRYAYVYKEMRCLSTFLYWIHTLCISIQRNEVFIYFLYWIHTLCMSIQRNEVFIYFFVLNTYAMHKYTKKWGVYQLFCTGYIRYA
jgi:hypothetical protein